MKSNRAKLGIAILAIGTVVCWALPITSVGSPHARKQLNDSKKPLDREAVGAVMTASPEATAREMEAPVVLRGPGLTHAIDISTNHSWDGLSSFNNEVIAYDLAAALGFPSGTPLNMTGIGWDVTIDTVTPGVGSWRCEARTYFDDNIAPDLLGLFLAPGIADCSGATEPGVGSYSSAGVISLSGAGIPDIPLPDGVLRIEFYESFDDVSGAIDANYFAGGFPPSSFTIQVDDPNATGACCEIGTQTCTATNTTADCSALGGHNWYIGEDCGSFTCPDLSGDSCADPLVVDFATDLPYADIGQTTCGRGNDHNPGSPDCLGSYDGGEEIIYELNVPSDMCVNIVMSNSDSTWTGMGVHNVCPPTSGCTASTSSAANESLLTLNLTAGTHYLQIDTWPSPPCIGSFDLSITECPPGGACCHADETCTDVAGPGDCTAPGDGYQGDGTDCANTICPPSNDDCDSATDIPSVPYAQLTNNSGATSGLPRGSCNSSAATVMRHDIWWSYTPPINCELNLFVDYSPGVAGYDGITAVYSGPDCNNITEIACLDSGFGSADQDATSFLASAGTTYWFQVGHWGSSTLQGGGPTEIQLDCQPLPTGACCVQDVGACVCSEVEEPDCTGVYKGDGTTCADAPHPCDCNGNGVCDDADLLPGAADVYSASPGLAIPDNDPIGLEHTINVPAGTVSDLNVELNISHTWVGDLCVFLTHPSGAPTVSLIQRPGMAAGGCGATGDCCGCGADDYNVVLDDAGAGGAIQSLCGVSVNPTSPPSYTPNQALSAFNGMSMAGDWSLTIIDNFAQDTGTLNSWALHFNAAPPTSEDCNGNGIPDECEADCNGNGIPDDCDVASGSSPDCNGNGIPDECDVASGFSQDCQGDGIPDECQLNLLSLMGTIVDDGSFEAGTPNPFWSEFESTFGTPLCDAGSCGTGGGTAGPNSGAWWAWFGGSGSSTDGSLEQMVTIPSGNHALNFYFWIGASSDNGTDFVRVRIDGNLVFEAFNTTPGYASYAPVSVDISPYAGGTRLLRFESTSGVSGVTNFNIDDVEIVSTGPPSNDCNGNGIPDECDEPVCGNDCREGGVGFPAEECDGTDDDACPGQCLPDCTCSGAEIPAASEWGLLVLALIAMVLGTIRFGWTRPVRA